MIPAWTVLVACLGLLVWAAAEAAARAAWPRTRARPAVGLPAGPPTVRATAVGALARLRRQLRPDDGAAAMPEAIETVASAVGAGRSPLDGLAVAAASSPPPVAGELAAVVELTRRGVALTTALDRWAATSTITGAPLVAAAVGLAGEAGGDTEAALVGVAGTLRERRALAREVRALSAQARLSAAVITAAPLGFLAVAVVADGRTAGFLLGSAGGLACLAAGVGLDLAGWLWMRRLTGSVR